MTTRICMVCRAPVYSRYDEFCSSKDCWDEYHSIEYAWCEQITESSMLCKPRPNPMYAVDCHGDPEKFHSRNHAEAFVINNALRTRVHINLEKS